MPNLQQQQQKQQQYFICYLMVLHYVQVTLL